VAADELDVLVVRISFLGFLIELLSRFDGDDGREVRRRPTCAMSLEGTRFDEHVQEKGPLESQYELLWRAPANDAHFLPPVSNALPCRISGQQQAAPSVIEGGRKCDRKGAQEAVVVERPPTQRRRY